MLSKNWSFLNKEVLYQNITEINKTTLIVIFKSEKNNPSLTIEPFCIKCRILAPKAKIYSFIQALVIHLDLGINPSGCFRFLGGLGSWRVV